jgi:hypothetical protein
MLLGSILFAIQGVKSCGMRTDHYLPGESDSLGEIAFLVLQHRDCCLDHLEQENLCIRQSTDQSNGTERVRVRVGEIQKGRTIINTGTAYVIHTYIPTYIHTHRDLPEQGSTKSAQ